MAKKVEKMRYDLVSKDKNKETFFIQNGHGIISGAYIKDIKQIRIYMAFCPGYLKDFVDFLCEKFGTVYVHFYNVLNKALMQKLNDYKTIYKYDHEFGEEIICLEMDWKLVKDDD